jgi:hypothetical protein
MAECILTGPQGGNLRGICPECDRLIYRRVNLAKIGEVKGDLDITFTQRGPRIGEIGVPSVNSDSSEEVYENP